MRDIDCGRDYDIEQLVDQLEEASAARQWEKINEPDSWEDEMHEAAKYIGIAVEHIDRGLEGIYEAESWVTGSPMEDMVSSYKEEILTLIGNLNKLKEKYERGER